MATVKAIIYKGIPYFSNVKVPTRVSQLANDAGYVTTDEKVKQTPNTTSMDSHPILFSASDSSGEVVGGAYKNSNFYYRPDANHLIFKNGGGIEISSGTTGVNVLSQYIRLTDLDDDHSIMNITTNDIELEDVTNQGTTYSNTWDGTHHSLKSSISSLVSKSGDTISGEYANTATFIEAGVTGKRVTTYGPWGIDVEEYVGNTLWSKLGLRDDDILLTKTWDGTHDSLKATIAYLGSQSAVNKVDYIHSTDASEYTIDMLANTDSLAVMGVTLSGTPTTNHGAFLNVKNVGTPFQLFMPDNVRYIYKRYRNNSTGAYYDWFKLDAGYSDTSGTSNYSNYTGVQRVSKDSRYKPGTNTLVVEEFQNNSANIPTNAWYHIYTSEGSDANYAVQLALGMTADGVYYRKCITGGWGNWIDLMRPSWGNISGKPTVVYANGGNKNVTAGTVINCCSFALSAGTYLIIYMAGFPAGQGNWKTCGAVVATANNSSSPINQAGLCNYRYGYDNETRVHGSTMHTVSANTTLYLNLWGRGSGALANCFGEMRAIRLY